MPLTTKSANAKDLRTGKSNMQHRHFATVAAIVREIPDTGYRADMAEHFADGLASTNSNFDRARFLAACGVKG